MWCKKEHAALARRGPLVSVDITGSSLSGTANEIFRRRQADLVRVHSECVRYLMRLGWKLPLIEPDRKSRVREGEGLSRAANRTDDHNSALAIDDTKGSDEDTILIACTTVWISTSTKGSWKARPPTLRDANMIQDDARVGRCMMDRTTSTSFFR
jgi:hypothetical protein